MDRVFRIHLVSDSTGETTYNLARACIVQFENIEVKTQPHTLVRTEVRLQKTIAAIESRPGAVIYTLIDKSLSAVLERECARIGVPCVNVLEGVMSRLEGFFGQPTRRQPGRQHQLDSGYFERIAAMQFSFNHDDGQAQEGLGEAEIVLVGVSRTSKTPTSIYLANQRGIKAANVPYVPGVALPSVLFKADGPFVVGLTTTPDRLVQIRRQRLRQLHEGRESDYVDPEIVRGEVQEARRLFTKAGWPVIDVSRKSIEEVAAEIIELFSAYQETRPEKPPGAQDRNPAEDSI